METELLLVRRTMQAKMRRKMKTRIWRRCSCNRLSFLRDLRCSRRRVLGWERRGGWRTRTTITMHEALHGIRICSRAWKEWTCESDESGSDQDEGKGRDKTTRLEFFFCLAFLDRSPLSELLTRPLSFSLFSIFQIVRKFIESHEQQATTSGLPFVLFFCRPTTTFSFLLTLPLLNDVVWPFRPTTAQ